MSEAGSSMSQPNNYLKMLQRLKKAPTKPVDIFLRVATLDGVNESCRQVGSKYINKSIFR